jgi:hypothetical protein
MEGVAMAFHGISLSEPRDLLIPFFGKIAKNPDQPVLNFEGIGLDWQSTSRRFSWRDGSVVGGEIALHRVTAYRCIQHNVSTGSLCEMAEAAGAVVTSEEAQSFM